MSLGAAPSFSAPCADATAAPFIDGSKQILVNGLRPWSGDTVDVCAPLYDATTGLQIKIGCHAEMSEEDALKALNCASDAWKDGRGEWPSMSIAQRAEAIRNLIIELKKNRTEMMAALQWEIAKNPADAATEFDRTMLYLEEVIKIALADDVARSETKTFSGVSSITKRAPVGVVLACGPANYPLNETYATVIPAILMGNTCVMKIPRKGGLCHVLSMAAFAKVLPQGVMNFVSGQGRAILGPMMKSGQVDIFIFVGSSDACEKLMVQHPKKHRLKTVLSLDAKNLGIVLPGCDLDLAVKECISGATSFNGQRCTALKLLYVHKSVAETFVSKFCEKLNTAVTAGSQLETEKPHLITPLGCQSPAYVDELVQDAVTKGAKIMNTDGGKRDRSLIFPSVLYPVDKSMRVFHEEQFGPTIPITVFETGEDIERYLDETTYGMQASVFVGKTTIKTQLGTPSTSAKDNDNSPNGSSGSEDGCEKRNSNNFPVQKLLHALAMATCRVNLNVQSSRGPDALPFAGRKSTGRGVMGVSHIIPEVSIEVILASKDKDLLVESAEDSVVFRNSTA